MFCQNCGMEVASTYKLCPTCGGRAFSTHIVGEAVNTQLPSTEDGVQSSQSVHNLPIAASPSDGLLNTMRVLLLVDAFINMGGLVYAFAMSVDLLSFTFATTTGGLATIAGGLIAVGTIFVIVMVPTWGMWTLKRWGRILFSVASFLVLLPDFAGQNSSGFGALIDSLYTLDIMVTGAILILVWFTPLKGRFLSGPRK